MLVLNIFVIFVSLLIKNRKINIKKGYGKELLLIIFTAIVFYIISLRKASQANMPLNFRTYVQICLFLLPAVYAFGFINNFPMNKIIKIMKITTIIVIIGYFLEPTHTPLQFLKISNWTSINFKQFISFTESSNYAEPFLHLFLFFYYFKDKLTDTVQRKKMAIFSIINLLFVILSFKRLGILFAVMIILFRKVFPKVIKNAKNFKFNYSIILTAIFVIATILYTKFMKGELFTNVDLYHFTSARDYILSLWKLKGYLSYGYGSSMLVIGRYLEMDLIQIYLELNVLALAVFCFTFFRVAKKNIYANLIMIYAFLNMLTASSLPSQIGWVITMIVISTISSTKLQDEQNKIKEDKEETKEQDNIVNIK